MHGGVRQGFKHDVVRTYGHLAKTSKIVAVAEYTGERANDEVSQGLVEAVAFGTLYMYNPDLYHRIQHGLPINAKGNVWAHYNVVDGDVRRGYSDYAFAAVSSPPIVKIDAVEVPA
jgi:2,4-dienoyl-CoA reductase-like NADH-dependent reductase (Old Yellow Enzyme family)